MAQILQFETPRGELIPADTLYAHLQIQEMVAGYSRIVAENGVLIGQMLAAGYRLPRGYEFDATTGRVIDTCPLLQEVA